MVQFFELSVRDKARALGAAREWRDAHRAHVDALSADGILVYPPSGSDIFKPELWKPPMWRWLARYDLA